jgi:hypothetical protein
MQRKQLIQIFRIFVLKNYLNEATCQPLAAIVAETPHPPKAKRS